MSDLEPTETPSEYLAFHEDDHWGRKTKRIVIVSKRNLSILGDIRWFSRWRQYAFFPEADTIWNRQCMKDVEEVIDRLMKERQ